MNVLITGAAGFIGSHLTEFLVKKGYNVKVFLHYNSQNNWGWLDSSKIRNEIEISVGDIRDLDSVSKAINGCSSVYHLAALIGIPYSYITPLAYIKTNIEGTYNVLEASKLNDVEKLIITSTSETYGSAQRVPMDEKHELVGQSPYSASKIAADQLSLSYNKSFGLPIKIVRPFNTFGPRQSARAIIPSIISQLIKSNTVQVGNIYPKRDFTYVRDTVSGFYEIASSDKLFGEVTNIGMNFSISIKDLISIVANMIGVDPEIKSDRKRIRAEQSEVDNLVCDNSKILSETNWKPKYSIESALEETIGWVKDNKSHFKSSIYNV